jgi:arsenite methyltransferase
MTHTLKLIGIAFLILALGLAFFWLVVLKAVARLAARLGHASPCPASFSWIVNNPVRRRYMRPILDRVGIRRGERVLELGPGPGAFSLDAHHLPLPDASVDRAFLITVLPEIPDRARALAELRRVLKPDGTLSVTEEFLDPDYLFAPETIRLVESAGFHLAQKYGGLWVYTLNFSTP